jgi:hypothetical protein
MAQTERISTAIASLPTGEAENDPQNTAPKLTPNCNSAEAFSAIS